MCRQPQRRPKHVVHDFAQADLVSGNNETPIDEYGNIHLGTLAAINLHYADVGMCRVALGVRPGGVIDFYNVYGADPIQLSSFPYANG